MNRPTAIAQRFAVLALLITAGCGPAALSPATPTADPRRGPIVPADVLVAASSRPRDRAPTTSPDDLQALAEGNTAFALDLYRLLAAEPGNVFFSPHSISVALAMTYAGARGDTADQMAQTLHFTLPPDRLHPAFNAYSLDLEARAEAVSEGTPFELSVANSLWGQRGYAFLPEFLDLLAEHYGVGMRLVDFQADPEAARHAINQWASDETRERIRDLIPPGVIDDLTRLVLANAIYFKAAWMAPFDVGATAPAPFYRLDGTSLEVQMMRQEESFAYALGDGYRAVVLPYETGNVSMVILLPDEGRFESIEQSLGPAMLEEVMNGLSYGPVRLGLPRFQFESSFNLGEALRALGMTDAFEAGRADFSGMDGTRDLYIQAVLHKAFVAVDEKGTEAAAATAVVVGIVSAPIDEPIEFTVDRPFIFLIRDDQTGNILFVGRVLSPEG